MDTTQPLNFGPEATFGKALLSPLPEGAQLAFACYVHSWKIRGKDGAASMFYCSSRAALERTMEQLRRLEKGSGAMLGRTLVIMKDGWAIPLEEGLEGDNALDMAAVPALPIVSGEELNRLIAEGKVSFSGK